MKLFLSITLPALYLILNSCEGGTTFTKKVHNKSSDTLIVTTYSTFANNMPVTIVPGASKEIFWWDQMGHFVDDAYTCTGELDSLNISVSGGKTLLTDPMDVDYWIRESRDGRNSREDCTFTVTDEDLQ
jgi:hypothetical protein